MEVKTPFDISHGIVTFMIGELGRLGWQPRSVDSVDDEEEESTRTAADMIEGAFAMDEAVLRFEREGDRRGGWVLVIPENGEDVLSDWPAMGDFAETMDAITLSLEHLQCRTCLKYFKESAAIEAREPAGAPEGQPDGSFKVFLHCPHCGSEDLQSAQAVPAA